MTKRPFFTIITSTKNASSTLPRLLKSLTTQSCQDFNWIIQDGASSDATMETVKQYYDRLPSIFADSCRDRGIYDAWNKALTRWQDKLGEWILFLGADDVLANPDVLTTVKEHLRSCPETVLYAIGELTFMEYKNGVFHLTAPTMDTSKTFRQRFYGMPLAHSALFHRRCLFLHERFDISFKICGDYDFILRTWTSVQQLYSLPVPVTIMGAGGISSAPHMEKLRLLEKRRAIRKNLPFDWKNSCRYIVLLIDTYTYPTKITLKKVFQSCSVGKFIWQILHKLHKNITG